MNADGTRAYEVKPVKPVFILTCLLSLALRRVELNVTSWEYMNSNFSWVLTNKLS